MKKNWFSTLNGALEAENLVAHWPLGLNISYSETVAIASRGRYISVTRDNRGFYERPIHYATKMSNGIVQRIQN